jgi:hypothetical protein
MLINVVSPFIIGEGLPIIREGVPINWEGLHIIGISLLLNREAFPIYGGGFPIFREGFPILGEVALFWGNFPQNRAGVGKTCRGRGLVLCPYN